MSVRSATRAVCSHGATVHKAPPARDVLRATAGFKLLEPSRTGNIDVSNYLKQDMIIIGTPEECLDKILKYEQAGVDQLLCYSQFGYLPHEAVMKSIELLGAHVIPELAKRGASNTANALSGAIKQAEAATS